MAPLKVERGRHDLTALVTERMDGYVWDRSASAVMIIVARLTIGIFRLRDTLGFAKHESVVKEEACYRAIRRNMGYSVE